MIDPTLDPITGLPVNDPTLTQYQVPLASQPINLRELNAQGKQGQWMYPDNLPPVVARVQARDLTNDNNAQDLSTDGNRNLNVNINALNPSIPIGGGSGGNSPVEYFTYGDSSDIVVGSGYTSFGFPISYKYLAYWNLSLTVRDPLSTNLIIADVKLVFDSVWPDFHLFWGMLSYGDAGSQQYTPPGHLIVPPRFYDFTKAVDAGNTSFQVTVNDIGVVGAVLWRLYMVEAL